MPDGVHLSGFSIEGFRSFASGSVQRVAPMSKVHLLAGPNNSGKSTVLQAVQRLLPAISGRKSENFWVVIDSDKTSAHKHLNATKRRVLSALRDQAPRAGGRVTAGYTIENYVPPSRLLTALAEVHPRARPSWNGERYANPLSSAQLDDRTSDADKAAVARVVVRDWDTTDDWPLDLRSRVAEVAHMIRQANDVIVAPPPDCVQAAAPTLLTVRDATCLDFAFSTR